MQTNLVLIYFLSLIFARVVQSQSLNILGVFPYQGRSHFFVFKPYLEELARRGHNVTVISYFPSEKSSQNYHDITLKEHSKILEDVFPIQRSYYTIFQISLFVYSTGTENCRILLADKNVQNLWKTKTKFDLVVVEQFNSDCSLGLAHALEAPVVGLTSHGLTPWAYDRFGVPYNPSYVSFQFLEGGTKPTLYQRIERTILNAYLKFGFKFMCQYVDQRTLAQYFDNVPPLEELARNIKFLLVYTHFVLTGPSLLPPNVIEVGGYHLKKPKLLSNLNPELQKFIDESEHGVIYISFGSMLKAISTPKEKMIAIINAISELPQRVIWKWDEDTLPGNPKNIYLSKWLPQNEILAHPKALAFYSHCGLLGTTEAIYHGVPMVAMPIFGDQPANAAAVEESGLGVQIQIAQLTKDNLLEKLKIVLDPQFRQNVKILSKAWHDRPTSAMESAIYWTEFAARYHNFTFRTPAADDLKKFIDESQHGVIYISFGTLLKGSAMSIDKIQSIISAISELPQRVIWKWNKRKLPVNSTDIYLSKWLPQNDILAHPKVVAFFSHCGLLGTTEAIYNGVPVVGMPIYGDQPTNAAAIEESGLGVQVEYDLLSKQYLLEKFKTVLNPVFRENVKDLSKAWHDRPIKAMDKAIFWTEFAARYKNVTFRPPVTDTPMYQYLCIDVYVILFIIVVVNIVFLKFFMSLLYRITINKLLKKSQSNKNKKAN